MSGELGGDFGTARPPVTGEECGLPAIINHGQRAWSMKRDRRGYRTYSITYRVFGNPGFHGPLSVLELTPDLPQPGDQWQEPELVDNYAYFTQEVDIKQVGKEQDNIAWDLTFTATNDASDECAQDNKDDPLAIPDRIRIESVDYQREGVFDKYGEAIANSAWEQYRGAQVEFDSKRYRIIIEQNAANLDLELLDSLLHHTNDAPLWGFGIGQVKFSGVEGEPKYYTNCTKYYLRRMIFQADGEGFDRLLLDEATKVLHGRWDEHTGSGLKATITVDGDGAVTGVSLNTTDAIGYPPRCIVPIKITPSGGGLFSGNYCVILVETNSSGLVTGFVRIHKPGSGYTSGLKNTTQRGQYVVLRLNGTGEVPDPNNPQHFDRISDMKSHNVRYILDGFGLPIADGEDPGQIRVEYYDQGNLLLLGIPLDLDIP